MSERLNQRAMAMSCIKTLGLWCFALTFSSIVAQNGFDVLGETSFAVNTQISNRYNANFSLRSRYFIYEDNDFNFNVRQIDLAHFSNYKLDFRHSISLGIQYRNRTFFEDISNEIRFIQQYDIRTLHKTSRFGHRFRFEQRLFENITIFRLRYRFAVDTPLNGDKLDPGEAYLIKSVEAVFNTSKQFQPSYDIRLNAQLGWLTSKSFRLQFGVEYRLEALNIATRQRLLILTTGVLNL